MMAAEDFCLKWNDHHALFFSSAESLCENNHLTDVTLSCGNRQFAAHKLVLSVCSGYFANLFSKRRSAPFNLLNQAIVYLKDVDPRHMELILQYMYRGEINVQEDDLMDLLNTAKGLRVKGLTEAGSSDNSTHQEQQQQQQQPNKRGKKRTGQV